MFEGSKAPRDGGKRFQRRIFGFASHAKPACLHVGKNVLHDLPEIGRAESMVAQIVTVAPEKKTNKQKNTRLKLEIRNIFEIILPWCWPLTPGALFSV